jgi:Protein of unknown function (DUF1553)/Protein of unknown function (DUF1549)/Planctomycete cytochrome C
MRNLVSDCEQRIQQRGVQVHHRCALTRWRIGGDCIRFASLFLSVCWFFSITVHSCAADEPADYLKQIRPILRERCIACHGSLKQEGGLRLDTAELAIKGGDSGSVIIRGDVSKSLIISRISATDVAERMPPENEGAPLSAEQILLVRDWIAAGAAAPADEQPETDPKDHWAFKPIVRPQIPQTPSQWVRNSIDAFLEQQHQKQGLTPQPEAPRAILLRRLYLDLIGIPPTADEISACEGDASPQWYEQTAKRLLDDPRHGERWARHWMDIWRYSDWWGLGDQLRNSQKHIWHWRDWIVESLNLDMPYDEMLRLMLAADELYPNDTGKLRATGYLARNYYLFNRDQWMDETVEHVSKGFLGLTMNCARCHDHKFDPLEQADYYRLRAFFEPYHVRLDVVPGESDLDRDAIPRAFDSSVDIPTYRYIRGDEKNPDKSKVIAPGVPAVLAFAKPDVKPVALPDEAWQPERRPWVLDAYLTTGRYRLEVADSEFQKAGAKLAAAKVSEAKIATATPDPAVPEAESGPVFITEQFTTLDMARWKTFGGEWAHEPGRVDQKKDGAARSALRLLSKPPQDFDASVRFTILGGSQYRSVGLSFDVSQEDPTQASAATDSEQKVYVSALSGGSKIQAAFHRGGLWQYPDGAAVRTIPVELNHQYLLRVQARGSLINASLDGQPLIAWESSLPRRNGAMQLVTFDAVAVFHDVTIRVLDPAVSLRSPNVPPTVDSPQPLSPEMAKAAVAEAQEERDVAEAALGLARAELESIERRAAAQRAGWSAAIPDGQRELLIAAVQAERHAKLAKARHSQAVAEQALHRATSDKREAAEKMLQEARQAFEKAVAQAEGDIEPTEQYTRLVGAMWTPTRFRSSDHDDPKVEFGPQSTGRRTALANWITDRRNPLTARVAVNHIWMRHMGQPLVPTVFDFGLKGTRPTHPELLDWLAAELIESGWSMKHLHSLIVNSAAYRMSSSMAGGEVAAAKDPENHYCWRRVPIRLESQVVRDSLLSLAGTLDSTMGGPPVLPAVQETSTRRSLYFLHSNNEHSLFLSMFDDALVKECYRREQSIVPQQALALTNSRLVLDASEQIARRLSEAAADDAAFLRVAFHVVLGITASDAELTESEKALDAWRKLPDGSAGSARANFVWTLINHNDFVTLR